METFEVAPEASDVVVDRTQAPVASSTPGRVTALPTERRVVNRLRRASGQLNAVIEAVEAGKPCRDVITQLKAVTSALDRAGFVILCNALHECLESPDEALATEGLTKEEVEKLFLMFA